MSEPLPMFPLGTVLLPGGAIPLHIFEPRYRQLVVDCLATDDDPPVFGTVLIERGTEVGGGDQRADVGVVAHIHQLTALDGGRYHCVAVGARRIRVDEWLADDPYPRARVAEWPDPDIGDPGLSDVVEALRHRVAAAVQLAVAAGVGRPVSIAAAGSPSDLLHHLAAVAPIGPADRYRLLAAPSVGERVERFDAILDDVELALRFQMDPPPT